MAVHSLAGTGAALHGHFDNGLPGQLVVDPGDTIQLTTLDCWWSAGRYAGGHVASRARVAEYYDGAGHALTGPIFVQGAGVGSTLGVHIDDIVPGEWGTTHAGGRATKFNVEYGIVDESAVLAWDIDAQAGTARDQLGHTVGIRPFLGVIGVAPAGPGRHSTIPPRSTGGNLDCKELVRGSVLYLPVAVEGALLSLGDGHAAQGDGEVGGTAIECPMAVTVTVGLASDLAVTAPTANTPAGWITMGLGATVDEATYAALNAMLDLLQHRFELSRPQAAAVASVVVDTRITQVVNETVGVHAVLPHGAVRTS
jgi:acetamidase/formamidase